MAQSLGISAWLLKTVKTVAVRVKSTR